MAYFPSVELKDSQNDREMQITTTKELKTVSAIHLIGKAFIGSTLDSNYWASTLVTGGTAVQADSIISLKTTTTSGSSSKITSVDLASWVAGSVNEFLSVSRFVSGGTTNNIRRLGVYDASNGYFFELNGISFRLVSRKNGVDTSTTTFNGHYGTSYTLDTNTHLFSVIYGTFSIEFYIDNILLHKMVSLTDPFIANIILPATYENINIGTVSGTPQLDSRLGCIRRLGTLMSNSSSISIATAGTYVQKIGSGFLHKIIVGSQATSTIAVYDNTAGSGTKLCVLDASKVTSPVTIDLEIPFNIGLTIVTTGTANYTIIYE